MQSDWISNLVCPQCKLALHLEGGQLVCADGCRYSLADDIATFLTPEQRGIWDDYHLEIYQADPLPPHPFYIRFTDTMLDLGCGDGVMSASSAHKVKEIYCVNPGISALHILNKRNISNMFPVNAFGESLPFRDSFFDGIFNIFVVEHLLEPRPMLKEIRRVMKPEGKLVIATDTAFYYKILKPFFEWRRLGWVRGWRKWKPNDPTHVNMMAPYGLRRLLREAGFIVLEEDIHYFIAGGKYDTLLRMLPHNVWEACLSSMFVFTCIKDMNAHNDYQ